MYSERTPGTAIVARSLGKHYHLYARPHHRLLQMLTGGRRRWYREFHALDDVSFELARGETLGVIGRNGAGKSTLLQLVCSTLRPSAGSVEVHGRIAALLELGTGFDPEFSGRDNVAINAAILGLTPAQIDERFEAIVAFSELGEFIEQPVKTYSSGMIVRLAFSVAVHVDPDILVVDEALSVGDAFFQAKCMQRIKRMLDDGTTLLFTSHDIAAVKALCRRVLWLDAGRVRALGPTDQVAALYSADWVAQANARLGAEPGAPGAAPAADGAVRAGRAARAGDGELAPGVRPIPEDATRSGDGRARIVASGWRVAGRPADAMPVVCGDSLTIEMVIEARARCERLVASYHIKDRHQQHLTGGHSADDPRVYGRRLEPGERLHLRFSLPVRLHAGSYTLTVLLTSIGDVASYSDAVFHDWIDDLAAMRVAARERFPLSDLVEAEHALEVEMASPVAAMDGAR